MKKKQCSGTKGYSCGRSCISIKKVCRKDGLAGQSVTLLNNLVEQIKSAPIDKPSRPSLSEITKMKKLGSGAFGTVYSDGKGTAYKVEEKISLNQVSAFLDAMPEIKDLIDKEKPNELSVAKNSLDIQRKAAKLGIAPEAGEVWEDNDKLITSMQELKNYTTLEDAYINLSNKQESTIRKAVLNAQKLFAKEGIIHHDLHAGNIMFNPETNDVKIIDFGLAESKGRELSKQESKNDFKFLNKYLA